MTGKKKGALYEHLNYRMGDFVLVGNWGYFPMQHVDVADS